MTGREPASRSTSLALLRRAQAGSRRAISALFARQLPDLRRWARGKLPGWARRGVDTADLVQDAVIRTIRNLHGFEPRGHGALQAYLRQSVLNAVRDEQRRAARRPTESGLHDEHAAASPTPLEEVLGRETSARYRGALARLPEDDQLALVARFEQQRSFEQIALILGRASPDAARMRVKRALARLAREMAGG